LTQTVNKNARLARILALAVIGMFGFGFAMVPLYSLICDVAGINSAGASSSGRVALEDVMYGGIDEDRLVTVEFDVTLNAGLPWDVKPEVKRIQVHPGKAYEVIFTAENKTDDVVVTQAVPGITPWQATEHFNKVECFCFSQQTLQPREVKAMPLRFVVNRKLPEKYSTVTLSYTFMDTDRSKAYKTAEMSATGKSG
jgi:cytochrome c oxidase assembly protein subunit 11